MSGISLGSNISALTAQRGLERATATATKVLQRLSSGQRINRASDDAAGLAISSSLNSSSRVFAQGARNINDGLSLLNIADGAVSELSGIVVRLRELSEQAANGTFSYRQRLVLDKEAQQLSKEFSRITQSTQFNGLHAFDGTLAQGVRLQAGYGLDGSILSTLGGKLGTGNFSSAGVANTGLVSTFGSTLGDVNGDGTLDLVTAGTDGASIGYSSIQLGNGDGTFGLATTLTAEANVTLQVSLGDLNGDGKLDLVTVGSDGTLGSSTVRLGNGNGTFGGATSYALGEAISRGLALNDLNNDGKLDLVTAGQGGLISVRLGQGDGTLGGLTTFAFNTTVSVSSAMPFVAGDFNNDGITDVAVSGSNGAGGGSIDIKLGIGDGTFGASVTYAAETNAAARGIALGDVNGDGILDLATTGSTAGNSYFTINLGNGNGSFRTFISYTNSGNTRAISLADVNGDGFLDLLSTNTTTSGLSVRLGAGNGTFASETTQATNTGAFNLSLGDLNGDGVLDVISAGNAGTDVEIGSIRDGINPLLQFSLQTVADARQAMAYLDRKLSSLSIQRGVIGAFQSRLASAYDTLISSKENYTAAASRISDTDVAIDAAELVRVSILQQASSAILGQANQLPSLALSLLR